MSDPIPDDWQRFYTSPPPPAPPAPTPFPWKKVVAIGLATIVGLWCLGKVVQWTNYVDPQKAMAEFTAHRAEVERPAG